MKKYSDLIPQTQISESDYDFIYHIADETGVKVTEVMRQAIAAYMVAPNTKNSERTGFICLATGFMVTEEQEAFISQKRIELKGLSKVIRNAIQALKNQYQGVVINEQPNRRYYYEPKRRRK